MGLVHLKSKTVKSSLYFAGNKPEIAWDSKAKILHRNSKKRIQWLLLQDPEMIIP